MNIIVCLDEKNGMMFNDRRQSKDAFVNAKISELVGENRLWLNEYTSKMFSQAENIAVDENFLEKAQDGDFCFVENEPKTLLGVENLYVFLWNRRYPADIYFCFDLDAEGFLLTSSEEFQGNSHEKITLNIYRRK